MNAFADKVNIFFGSVSTILAIILGDFWFFFFAFFILNIADYGTGWAKAKYNDEECSDKGAKGIAKKVGYWVIIGIAFFVSVSCEELGKLIGINLSFLHIVGYFTLATYIVNEIRSIVENLVLMGVKVPAVLIHGLAVAKNLIDHKTEAVSGKIESHEIDKQAGDKS